jgi:hypothetical protein
LQAIKANPSKPSVDAMLTLLDKQHPDGGHVLFDRGPRGLPL